MSWNLSRGWKYRLSPQEVVLEKSFARSSVLSELLWQQSSWQISLPVGPVCVRRLTHNLLHAGFSTKACQTEASASWELLFSAVGGLNSSAGDPDLWLPDEIMICFEGTVILNVRFWESLFRQGSKCSFHSSLRSVSPVNAATQLR